MVWNEDMHFYVPTTELFKNKLGVILSTELGQEEDDGEALALEYCEDMAYWVKDFALFYGRYTDVQLARKQIEYIVAMDDNNEKIDLQRAYVEFMRYAFNDEGDLVGVQTGLNVVKGQVIPVAQLRGSVELSGALERILTNSGILYRGYRDWEIDEDAVYGVDY